MFFYSYIAPNKEVLIYKILQYFLFKKYKKELSLFLFLMPIQKKRIFWQRKPVKRNIDF